MELQEDKINRQVYFMTKPSYNDQSDPPGLNNRWIYDRAPDGYKFVLHSWCISTFITSTASTAVINLFDGHEFTNWLLFPGVESREIVSRITLSKYVIDVCQGLNGWECKEFTIGGRNLTTNETIKSCIIIWYYLKKMSELEKYQYATMQPKGEHIRKSGRTTVESTET